MIANLIKPVDQENYLHAHARTHPPTERERERELTFKLSCNPQSRVLPSELKVKQRTPVV